MVFLENFYASEFTVGNMNGSESSRAEDLAMFSSGDMKPAVITDGELKVTIYGQAAMQTNDPIRKGRETRASLAFRRLLP
jgi:hypothetical protein